MRNSSAWRKSRVLTSSRPVRILSDQIEEFTDPIAGRNLAELEIVKFPGKIKRGEIVSRWII